MRLSIVIPVYNEAATVARLVERVLGVAGLDREVILVDDGSTDGTREALADLARRHPPETLRIVYHERNAGKGAAVRTGVARAQGDYVIFQDADLELDPGEIPALLAALGPDAPVVYGSRFLRRQAVPPLGRIANLVLTAATNLLYGARLTDMETCYKLCPREALLGLGLRSNRFEIEPEITCKLLRRGYRIREVPVTYRPRTEGKKIGWKDGVAALRCLVGFRMERLP